MQVKLRLAIVSTICKKQKANYMHASQIAAGYTKQRWMPSTGMQVKLQQAIVRIPTGGRDKVCKRKNCIAGQSKIAAG